MPPDKFTNLILVGYVRHLAAAESPLIDRFT